jgi:uncharacterized membrane protein SpoIIM required for sporulation
VGGGGVRLPRPRWTVGWDRARARRWAWLAGALLAAGAVLGAGAAASLPPALRQGLQRYVAAYAAALRGSRLPLDASTVFAAAFATDARAAALVWLGGLFAVGAVLAAVVLFSRAFALGFAVSLLAATVSPAIALAAALPTLLALAVLCAEAAVAISFSWRWLRARSGSAPRPTAATVALYAASLVVCLGLLVACDLVDVYLVPRLLRAAL